MTFTAASGNVYTLRHVDTSLGLALGARIANMAAPILRAARKGTTIEAVIEYIVSQPDLGANLQYVAKQFAVGTSVQFAGGGADTELAPIYEAHFAGRYDELVEWLRTAIRFDLSSFLGAFSRLRDELENALPKKQDSAASSSPTDAKTTG